MQGGFSFCGVDIAKFGLEYVPPLSQTYVFGNGSYDVHQESFSAHDGGYFYGTTVQPKDFILRCFFQDSHIAHGTLAAIDNFFRRGKTGRLIFERRQWLWYTATVVDVDTSNLNSYQNGFVTITMRAYYPFARHDYISVNENNEFDDYIIANSGLLTIEETPNNIFDQLNSDIDIMLYNGGSEKASVAIAIAGDAGEGVTIKNKTTNQTAKFISFTKDITTNDNKYIVSDALNGKTVLTDGTNSQRAYLYHDHGFIELAPSFPIERDIYVSYEYGSNKVDYIGNNIGEDAVGRHIKIDNTWYKITDINDGAITIDGEAQDSGSKHTNIVTMNEISIRLGHGADLTKLHFIYKPTFQ